MREKTILAVDDDASSLLYLAQVLKAEGYRVLSAENGRAALDLLRSEAPDLILLDVQMPGMGGYELLEHLRERERTAHVPVIFLTVKDTREDEAQGLREGVVDYLSKEILTPERVKILCYRLHNFFAWQENERLRGVLATIVSANHEINNPLAVIVGSIDVLKLKGVLEGHPEGAGFLQRITVASNQIKDVLDKITHLATWEVKPYLEGVEMLDLGE